MSNHPQLTISNLCGLLILVLGLSTAQAQIASNTYYVQFTDKANTPYTTAQPQAYLSQRAILRRQQQQIPVTNQDLPVDPTYVDALEQLTGVDVMYTTKWLNGAVVQVADEQTLQAIANFPFVDENDSYLELTGKRGTVNPVNKSLELGEGLPSKRPQDQTNNAAQYGDTWNQVHMMQLDALHDQGYLGQGMWIAVMDGGFTGVDTLRAFESLFNENRILETLDWVDLDATVYEGSGHGTAVLSCLAADQPGLAIGTAPEASYILMRTEDVASEQLIEEFNWIVAAEYADSMGVDILTTSLGYTTYDDSRQDHTYDDLDGRTTPITRGARTAASRGMLVVNSAGNEGWSSWFYIGAPADADSVLSVGAVRSDFLLAAFSSRRPQCA